MCASSRRRLRRRLAEHAAFTLTAHPLAASTRTHHGLIWLWDRDGTRSVIALPGRTALPIAARASAIALAPATTTALNNIRIGDGHRVGTIAIAAAPLIVAATSAVAAPAPVTLAVTGSSAVPLGPAYRAGRRVIGIAASAPVMAPAIMILLAVFAVPVMPLLAPIASMMVAHCMAPSVIVEEIIAVAWIPVTVMPATAKTDIVKATAVVAVIVAVITAIGVASVIVIIAVAGIAETDVVDAARQRGSRRRQCHEPKQCLLC